MLKLLLVMTLTVQVVLFSQDAGELALWIPGLLVGALGLALGDRKYFDSSDLFYILFLFLFVVAPADQINGLRFQGDISVRGIIFPEHVLTRSVVLADLFGACVLAVKILSFIKRPALMSSSTAHKTLLFTPQKSLTSLDSNAVLRKDVLREIVMDLPDHSHSLQSIDAADEQLIILDDSAPPLTKNSPLGKIAEFAPVAKLRRSVRSNIDSASSFLVPASKTNGIFWILAALALLDLLMLAFMVLAMGGTSFITDGRDYPHRLYERNPALAVVTQAFLQVVPLIGFIVSIITWQRLRSRAALVWLIVLALLCLVFNNPLNTARFQFGAYALMIMLFVLNGRIRSIYCYVGIISYLLVIMPVMSVLRGGGVAGLASLSESSFVLDYKQLDYDAFSMFTCSVYRTGDDGFTGGTYLLSVLLFFVPRNLWPDKPLPSSVDLGQYLMQHHSGWFDNLSCPPFGDFYMDFGILGVILGGFFYGTMLLWSDRVFASWSRQSVFIQGSAAAVMGYLPILVRGSLAAVVGGFLVTIMLFWVISLTAKTDLPTSN